MTRVESSLVLRRVLSWLVIAVATLLGMLAFAQLSASRYIAPVVALATCAVGAAAVVSSLVATRNPRKAASIALWTTPIAAVPTFLLSWGFTAIVLIVAGALVLPGLFWFATSRRGWPLPISSPILPGKPRLRIALCAGAAFTLVVVAVLSSLLLPWWPPIGDCGGRPLLSESGSPRFTDFTAKVLFVGPPTYFRWSLVSIARVEHRYSDPTAGPGGLVILRGFFKPTDKSERYFVESIRSRGLLAHFLPVFEPVDCGHTANVKDAAVALRILRDGPPPSGGRVIGRVYSGMLTEPHDPRPGVSVLLKGPAGSRVSVTDAEGIYDFTDLPPGAYTVEPLTATGGRSSGAGFNLTPGEVEDRALFVE